MSFLQKYIDKLEKNNQGYLADAIKYTSNKVLKEHILINFDWTSSYKVGLLFGHVQSGKTGHALGVIAKAADEGFNIFLLLTADNVSLQKQTLARSFDSLSDLNICDENDDLRFNRISQQKPTVLVLKKNANILKSWESRLAASKLFPGNPLFIIDDEADASSLNTKINKKDFSTINSTLRRIRELSKCGIYLQLTATPQSLFLQASSSNWKPEFVESFPPGDNYVGGDFFFSDHEVKNSIFLTDDQEIKDLLNDDEFASNGLIKALITFLITSSHLIKLKKEKVCNFVVHPSVRISHHTRIAEKVGAYLNNIKLYFEDKGSKSLFDEVYRNLKDTQQDLIEFEESMIFIREVLEKENIKINVMNSLAKIKDYQLGMNIIIGGNSLSRGITFPKLQTMYYCRTSKLPQADTVWQHCRMFGYDREGGLVRAFMPPKLYMALTEINSMNNSIFSQIKNNMGSEIKIYSSKKIRPTRQQVVDLSKLLIITGGVNYFAFDPINNSIEGLDDILKNYEGKGFYNVNPRVVIDILKKIRNKNPKEWSNTLMIDCIKSYILPRLSENAILIVRRNRDIAPNTGTLLSPDDRQIGQEHPDTIVLTLYKVTGKKGWDGQQLWVPNIKFPEGFNFYDVR